MIGKTKENRNKTDDHDHVQVTILGSSPIFCAGAPSKQGVQRSLFIYLKVLK